MEVEIGCFYYQTEDKSHAPVWPDGYLIILIFDHLEEWKIAENIKYLLKLDHNYQNTK